MSYELIAPILLYPQRFLLLALYKFKVLTKPRFVNIKTSFGRRMTIVLPEIVSSLLYLTGTYEPDVENIFQKFVKKGDVVVDIGAHYGYFTLLAATLVGKMGKVYSFEPTPSTFNVLQKNTNRYKNIMPVNKAVYDKHDSLVLHDYGLQFGALNSFFEPRIKKKITFTSSKVAAVTLDEYFSKVRRMPDFIKIDAESSEFFILKGMKKILSNKRPILCLELGDMDISGVKTSKEIIYFLVKKKYTAHLYKNNTLSRYKGEVLKNKHINLLFLPE